MGWHEDRAGGRRDKLAILSAIERGHGLLATSPQLGKATGIKSARVSQLLSSMYWYDALMRDDDFPRHYWPGPAFDSYRLKLESDA